MIAWLLAGWIATAPGTQGSAAVEQADAVETVLRRDPRDLPHAPADRWKGFDASELEAPEELPPGMVEAVRAIRERDLPGALVGLYRSLDAEPDFPPALYELGVVYFRLQRYGDGAAAFERFLEVVPGAVGRTRALGHCYYSLGDHARAKAHYERVLAVAPREVEALRGLALSELHLGRPERAADLLDRVLEIDPRHAEAWTWKARVLYDLDRPAEALDAARRARDLDPFEPQAWYLLGRILLEQGEDEEGREAQARYTVLSTASQEARAIEGRLEYDPHQPELLSRLVDIHRGTGNVPAARQALARLVSERPFDVTLRIRALDVLEALGDAEGSRVAALVLRERFSDDWRAWQRLERYYAATGQRIERLEAGERYRRLKGD